MAYKLFIVEDHPVMRSAYARLIKRHPDFEICGEAESGDQALKMIPNATPDLVMVDISLPGMNGIELLNCLKVSYPKLPTLVISGHEETLYAKLALQAGAKGYLVKVGLADVIIQAIRQVLRGELYMNEELRHKVLVE
jgi:DNA-binding NarL/FixJ family response regulator